MQRGAGRREASIGERVTGRGLVVGMVGNGGVVDGMEGGGGSRDGCWRTMGKEVEAWCGLWENETLRRGWYDKGLGWVDERR